MNLFDGCDLPSEARQRQLLQMVPLRQSALAYDRFLPLLQTLAPAERTWLVGRLYIAELILLGAAEERERLGKKI